MPMDFRPWIFVGISCSYSRPSNASNEASSVGTRDGADLREIFPPLFHRPGNRIANYTSLKVSNFERNERKTVLFDIYTHINKS